MATSGDDIRDEDRLPWLETVEEEREPGPSAGRVIALVVAILALIAAVIFGYSLFERRGGASGDGSLITAQEGDYKVKPDEPGGMNVQGEGDSAIATSDGATSGNSSIDMNAVPETPVPGKKAAPSSPAATRTASKPVTAVPASSGKLAPVAPKLASAPAVSGGGALVQLGSFPSEASANAAWASVSKRLPYLAPLGKAVQKAEVDGRTVYRLRVNAGSSGQAAELCGKLKVAGEPCFVARD